MKTHNRRLMWHGTVLFHLGLTTGLFEWNRLMTSIAAAFGTAANSPITLQPATAASHGKRALSQQDFLTVAIAIIATSILVLRGLRGTAVEVNNSWKHPEFNIPLW